MADVQGLKSDPRTTVAETSAVMLNKRGKPHGWKVDLFKAVAKTSGCDMEVAQYTFSFLVNELERLNKEYGDGEWAIVREKAREWGTTTHYVEQRLSAQGQHPLKNKLRWLKGATETVI